jgi:uncharacterized membrane protein YtjA (UPF0391 family)
MTRALSVLFIQLIAHVRGAKELAGLMAEPMWLWLVVSLVLFFISVVAGRRSMLLLWSHFQRRAVQ